MAALVDGGQRLPVCLLLEMWLRIQRQDQGPGVPRVKPSTVILLPVWILLALMLLPAMLLLPLLDEGP